MKCPKCHNEISDLPMCYGSNAPYLYYSIDEEDRETRTKLTSDFCVIDGKYFFVRGHIEISIKDNEPFIWSVWVSLSEQNFLKTNELLEVVGRENDDPYFGWLSTELIVYPSTINLKTEVYSREVGLCPLIVLEPTDHPLSIEQNNGTTMERVLEIYHLLNHE